MRYCTLLLLLLCTLATRAQRFGGTPAKQQWLQINTDTLRVIFPANNLSQAQKVAGLVHQLQTINRNSLGNQLRKVSMVLQHRTMISNGYVGLAPFRSELYTTAPHDAFGLGASSWMGTLAIHEYRHVQQYANFNRGLSKFAGILLGEEGQAVANAAAVPDWFFEGDAVYNETLFSSQGRGKLPLFMNSFPSLEQAGKQYSYMKWRNGSYRHYVPGHYELGYLLVAYGRQQYGHDIWQKVTADAAAFKPLIYPFQGAVKKHMGIPYTQFVQEAMAYYKERWKITAQQSPQWIIGEEPNNVVNYQYPQRMEDGALVVLEESYRLIPHFSIIQPNGQKERIAVRDVALDPYFSYRNGHLIYASYKPDARWGNVEYSTLQLMDIKTRQRQQIAGANRWVTPDINPQLNKALAILMLEQGGSAVVQVDIATQQIDTLLRDTSIIYSYPKYNTDGSGFYVAQRTMAGNMNILYQSTNNNSKRELMPLVNTVIGNLLVQGDTVLYSTSRGRADESWALVDKGGSVQQYRLASYGTGIYQAVIGHDGKLYGSVFTAHGYRIGAFEPRWEKTDGKESIQSLYVSDQLFAGSQQQLAGGEPLRNFTVTKYRKAFKPLNIHSWRPYYDRPEYSFTLYGNNVLNTISTEIAYTYNENEQSHRLGYAALYGGSYLQPLVGVNHTWQRSGFLRDTLYQWNEWDMYAGVRLPLNITGGRLLRGLTLQATVNQNLVRWTGRAKSRFLDANYTYTDLSLSYVAQSQRAVQHILPRWGHALQVRYRQGLGSTQAHQFLLNASVNLPGLVPNHNLVLTGAIQTRDTLGQYAFSNNFPFSRGYTSVSFPRMYKVGVNYHFPVCYPDWGVGNMVYLLRVRANTFYDHSVGKSLRTGRYFYFGAVGAELFFDTRWWNQEAVTVGVRYSRLLDDQVVGVPRTGFWELILPVGLFR
jgi:hypothetical protein